MKKIILKLFVITIMLISLTGCEFSFLSNSNETTKNNTTTKQVGNINDDSDFNAYILELGNKYTGDSIFIKAGEVDILIDAGSRENSGTAITEKLKTDCNFDDDIFEYVIATHAHQDHIAGFVGENGVFNNYGCKTIIDFGLTNATSNVYKKYVELRDKKVLEGTKYYTQNEVANETYTLTENITMKVLYNYFGENKTDDENDYSVCLLFTVIKNDKTSYFLFTGDLEKEGEKKLVENNVLPEVDFFKANHHGSYTANSDELLSVIKPKNVGVSCVAGSDEYTSVNANMFPSQTFFTNVSKYTKNVYVTGLMTDDEVYTSYYGCINVSVDDDGLVVVDWTNKEMDKDISKTTWFMTNRRWNEEEKE